MNLKLCLENAQKCVLLIIVLHAYTFAPIKAKSLNFNNFMIRIK